MKKMMQCKWFICINLIVFLFLALSVRVLANLPVNTKVTVSSRDSLKILDSLVSSNKVLDNVLAKRLAKRALVIAKQIKSATAMAEAYKLLGIAYFPDEKDSSYLYFNAALKIADSAHILEIKVPVIYNLAMLYAAAYNYADAITFLDSSVSLATSINDLSGIARAYIALGTIDFNTHDFENARKQFEEALAVASKDSLFQLMGVALGNLAKVEFEKDRRKSIFMQKQALSYLRKTKGNEEEMAYILINMGNRYTNPDSALYYYQSALKIAVNARLSKIQFGAYNNMAYSYLDKGNIHMAESCLRDHAIPVAADANDHDWLSSLYDTYADVCVARNDYKTALEMQKKALKERIMAYNQKASEQLRLLASLLDLKNKEITIQREQRELLTQRNRLQKTQLWLAITVLLVVLLISFSLVLQQRNRVRIHNEQIISARKIIQMEETEKGRTARELHDLTGQLVLGLSGTIENIDFVDEEIKNQIKGKINELGASIRQISHRMNRAMIEHFTFTELITGLCEDFNKLSGMHINLEISGEFVEMPNDLVLHFYRITQELLTNAGKYARNSQVDIKIETAHGKLSLNYTDNGDGFETEKIRRTSMGIINIFERTKLIGGHAVLNSAPGNGTTWKITLPYRHSNGI